MTSLIDVIFLLLLFFMLSSTFSRFAEVEIKPGGRTGAAQTQPGAILFLRLSEAGMTLNGRSLTAEGLRAALAEAKDATLLVSVTGAASAQALADVLVVAGGVPDIPVTVLEAS